MVERLNPHALVKEPPLLGSDALIHVLHYQADAMGKVTVGLLHVDDLPSKIDYMIEARVSFAVSFSPCICQNAPLLDFRRSIPSLARFLPFDSSSVGYFSLSFLEGGKVGRDDSRDEREGTSPVLGVESAAGVAGGGAVVVGLGQAR